ncbi:DUF421 domain-containing protein [Thiohalorhabdus methylotrophus]|uniref:DUF421 domain-containing protein n=1 Tax=Thiohalorhabdus methylotrophus TaxID=3242694 RepID=A0ABV4TVB5_9GAMM
MLESGWILTPVSTLVMVLVSVLLIYTATIFLSKIAGPRSFSEMSGFDFAVTIALGSVIASTVLTAKPPLLNGLVAILGLLTFQGGVAFLRRRYQSIQKGIDHPPLLLMAGTEILWDNMRRGQITQEDLWAQLRGANVNDIDTLRAVVLETTGHITVLHGFGQEEELDPRLLMAVEGREKLPEVARSLNEL